MDLELLQSISLAVSQVRTVDTVLKMIVDGLVETAGFALARIWLIGPCDICATCLMRGKSIEAAWLDVNLQVGLLAVVGEGMRGSLGLAGCIFSAISPRT